MRATLQRGAQLALLCVCATFLAIAAQTGQSGPEATQTQTSSFAMPTWLPTTCATLLVGFLVWWFNQWSIRRSSRQDHVRMLLDIDRQLIEKPRLWLIYDDYPIPSGEKKDEDTWDPARREAFIYFHLNMFEAFFDFHRQLAPLWDADKEYEKSWRLYIKDFFKRSSEARKVWDRPQTKNEFSKGFVRFIADARDS